MTSWPAATASWMALLPTLEEPAQTRTVFPFGFADTVGYGNARKSFWNSAQAAVDRPRGRTHAFS